MADPMAILDAKARELYEDWCQKHPDAGWNPFNGTRESRVSWPLLSNHERECWRTKALPALRSEETVADELKREERERLRAPRDEEGA